MMFEFGYGDSNRAREVYHGYRSAGGPGRVRRRGDFSMTIAQLGHITEMACRLWLDPTTPDDERHRQAGRVAESVEQPLTVAVIDELLDAVSGVSCSTYVTTSRSSRHEFGPSASTVVRDDAFTPTLAGPHRDHTTTRFWRVDDAGTRGGMRVSA